MRRLADAAEPPVVVPIIVVAVDADVALIVVAVEGRENVQRIIWSTAPRLASIPKSKRDTLRAVFYLGSLNPPMRRAKYFHF